MQSSPAPRAARLVVLREERVEDERHHYVQEEQHADDIETQKIDPRQVSICDGRKPVDEQIEEEVQEWE